jgi:hypothetical protein
MAEKGTRKSPIAHAAKQIAGTYAKGTDGNIYVVTERKDGTLYWKKTILADTKIPKKYPKTSKHLIAVGEVSSTIISARGFSVHIKVNDDFYSQLKKKPKAKICKDKGMLLGNAYIFGPLYKNGYVHLGYHGNDAAQTGLLDMTKITKNELDKITAYEPWTEIYLAKKKVTPWDDRSKLPIVQKQISPRILFVGETIGGDVGADVYVHLHNNEIDSLIIDNNCLFRK